MRELTITDGVATAQLNTAPARIFDYMPQTPPVDARASTTDEDGGEQARSIWRNVTETATIQYDTQADLRAAVTAINRLFELARRRQTDITTARAWVQYRPDMAETLYRSEILAGRVALVDPLWRRLSISWSRRYYWESTSLVQLNLYNDVAASSSQITLYNHHNVAAGRSNVAKIAAASIAGDLPAPAKIELTNTYASGTRTGHVRLAHRIENTALTHIIEAESGTLVGGGALVTNAAYSNGQMANIYCSGATEMLAWYGAISSAMLNATAGGWFRLLAYLPTGASANDVRIRARISIDLLTTLWEGDWVATPYFAGDIIDLGAAQLPSALAAVSGAYPLTLELRTKRGTNSSATVPIDYLHLLPARRRFYESRGYDIAQGVALVDEPYDGMVFTSGWAGGLLANYVAHGSPIMLTPNKINTLHLAINPTDAIVRSTQLRVWHRPRRVLV